MQVEVIQVTPCWFLLPIGMGVGSGFSTSPVPSQREAWWSLYCPYVEDYSIRTSQVFVVHENRLQWPFYMHHLSLSRIAVSTWSQQKGLHMW